MSGVIFDLDGTLIDATRDMLDCATAMLEAEGLPPVSLETVKSFVGNGLGAFVESCLANAGEEADEVRLGRMYATFHACYVEAVGKTTLYPHVRETLEALAADGYRLGICTNKARAPTHAVLEHLDLARYFEAFAYGDGAYPRKPDAAALRHVIDGLPARRFLFVGDSEIDAETARNAKIPMALFTEGLRKKPVDRIPHDAAFADFRDLPAIVARLVPRPD